MERMAYRKTPITNRPNMNRATRTVSEYASSPTAHQGQGRD